VARAVAIRLLVGVGPVLAFAALCATGLILELGAVLLGLAIVFVVGDAIMVMIGHHWPDEPADDPVPALPPPPSEE
jgi:hypothetical protein